MCIVKFNAFFKKNLFVQTTLSGPVVLVGLETKSYLVKIRFKGPVRVGCKLRIEVRLNLGLSINWLWLVLWLGSLKIN